MFIKYMADGNDREPMTVSEAAMLGPRFASTSPLL